MYQGLVFLHLLGVIVFALAHGVSMFAAFRVRRETDPRVVASILDMSRGAISMLYVGLLLLGIGGLGAAWQAGWLLSPWAVASYGVVIVVLAVMYGLATPYYVKVRELVGDGSAPVDPDELRRVLDTRRPELLVSVGATGLLVLLWLMVFRPQ